MIKYKRILVVIDPGADCHHALIKAARLANSGGAHLDLVACIYNDQVAGTRFGDSAQLRQSREKLIALALQQLEKLAGPLRDDGLNVDVHALFHHPFHEGIANLAHELRPDIIVKDTHYHHVLQRTVFSNTDWELIRKSRFDLLLTKPHVWADSPVILAAVDPLHTGDKPAALDRAILDQGVALTDSVKGTLRVVHCFPVMAPAAIAGAGLAMPEPMDSEVWRSGIEKSHRAALDELLRDYAIPSESVFLVSGDAHRCLVDMARTLCADIMVVGAVSRSRLREAFLGFTALHILDRLPCDLLIEKMPQT